ncbi:MAG TPA: PhzF family phenazine biosynthesis protein [Saprospiraceae bacterium]|nr:PhzF family phenazine biosynthesis protein [Saprospiraceae bacterium]
MNIKLYQVDAFTDTLFKGNPAAVCPLEYWPEDDLLQNIAMENNLAETAFYIKMEDHFEIRWFTPSIEVDLCGHAPLATAHVLIKHEGLKEDVIRFISPRSGILNVFKKGDYLTLDFPVDVYKPVEITEKIQAGFSIKIMEAYLGKTDYMLVFKDEDQIRKLEVDLIKVANLEECRGVIVTAPGTKSDFVSRFFAPQSGINEDPVTGSSHTTLTPYWSDKLGKQELTAYQLSQRGGYLKCKNKGKRVEISGKAKTFMVGEIVLESFPE